MKHGIIAVDWDGTLVEQKWPEMGDWLPGARPALNRMTQRAQVVIYSCRVSPYAFGSGISSTAPVRPIEETKADWKAMRKMLDDADFHDVAIWYREDKPPADLYIDNHGLRFSGDWEETMGKVDKLYNDECTEQDCGDCDCLWNDGPAPADFHATTGEETQGSLNNVLWEWRDLHMRKAKDYGNEDPLANVRSSEMFGMPAWVGVAIRLQDKMSRLATATRQAIEDGNVEMANEKLIDTFNDIGVYAAIGRVLYEEWEEGK